MVFNKVYIVYSENFLMVRPNLFIVGAAKSGTSSIEYYLSQHPDIFMKIPLEPNFFANDVLGFEDRTNLDWYLSLFKNVKNEKYIGEKSAMYLYSEEAAKRIKDFNPDSKIIITLRNPVDMANSQHNHMISHGSENIIDFGEALKLEQERKGKLLDPREYVRIASYYEQVKRYIDLFGKKNVKIVIFEEMKENPDKIYKEIIKFLGLKPVETDFKVINESKIIKSISYSKVLYVIMHLPRPVKWILKKIIPIKMRDFIRNINLKQGKVKPVESELRAELNKQFKPDIHKLEKLIGKNLSIWTEKQQ